MANNHLIGKQVFHIEVGSSKDTYALQQQLSEMCRENLTPHLEELFNRYVGEEEVLQLKKIEIDLGEINLDKTNHDSIVNKILLLVEEEMKQNKPEIISIQSNFRKGQKPSTGESIKEYMFRLWLYWLENGVLPVYGIRPGENWMPQVLEVLATEHTAISQLKEILAKNEQALQRLILQHNVNDLKAIAELYTGFHQQNLSLFLEEFRLFAENEANIFQQLKLSFRELEVKSWELVFREVIFRSKKVDSEYLQKKILYSFPRELVKNIKETGEKKPENFLQWNRIIQSVGKNYGAKEEIGLKEDEENVRKNTSAEENQIPVEQEEKEGLQFVRNAGLVILHPFLFRFFQKLKLVENKDFKDPYSQVKSVLLLQFLTTGKEIVPEYDMFLPKFLCSMPANLPIDHKIQLEKTEKEEANNLLKAVIENWGALGATSPDGLREGFFRREGKFIKNDSGWKLVVEAKAIDILLDKLPWGISIIKLPWMEEHLKVEWR